HTKSHEQSRSCGFVDRFRRSLKLGKRRHYQIIRWLPRAAPQLWRLINSLITCVSGTRAAEFNDVDAATEATSMEKPAETQYPIEEILRRRWSPRSFSDLLVEPEKLQSLFEAARWAASSFNEQPWNFIVATKQNPEEHARL